MDKAHFLQLLNNYLLETITEDETRQLFLLLEQPAYQQIFKEQVGVDLQNWTASGTVDTGLQGRIKNTLHSRIKEEKPVRFIKTVWLRYAAAIVLLSGAAAWFYYANKKPQPVTKQTATTILPGTNKAYLTLADGTKINLDNAADGNLAQQGNVQVVKLANGQIAYSVKGVAGKEVMWNTMSTPAGGQYQVILPDGTKVWLNAASTITYPTAFTTDKRTVTIKGEVYLEVAKNKQPFVVDVDGRSKVEVLGTSFNINSYENEASINTTLLEGSVRVTKAHQSAVLKPGQQAVVGNSVTVRSDVNTDQALAWKNGFFDFEGLDLKAVMRQLERWYDIKVQYQGAVDNGMYGGKVYRSVNLADVLEILQKVGGVQFRLEGKTLTVL